jgi:hypothetical protein
MYASVKYNPYAIHYLCTKQNVTVTIHCGLCTVHYHYSNTFQYMNINTSEGCTNGNENLWPPDFGF